MAAAFGSISPAALRYRVRTQRSRSELVDKRLEMGKPTAPGRRALLSFGLALAAAPLASVAWAAAPPAAVAMTPQDLADLRRISDYLNGIHTMTARFQQRSAGAGAASGSLWLARPGRMRFEYDLPSPILLIADRFYVYYVDKQLAEMSKIGLKSTPAWFLLREPITFDDLVVTRLERGANGLTITVVDPAEPDKGSLTMLFARSAAGAASMDDRRSAAQDHDSFAL